MKFLIDWLLIVDILEENLRIVAANAVAAAASLVIVAVRHGYWHTVHAYMHALMTTNGFCLHIYE